MINALASEGDVAEIITLYVDFFSSPAVEDSVSLDDQHATLGIQLGEKEGTSTDLGVEVEAVLSPETLASSLGFSKERLPILFNHYRHRAGLSAWDPANEALFNPDAAANSPDMVPIALHWHQLAGLHAVIRMNFDSKPVLDKPFGCLIADAVGLGTTFLSATIIAFLSDVVTCQSMINQSLSHPVRLPPILGMSELFIRS